MSTEDSFKAEETMKQGWNILAIDPLLLHAMATAESAARAAGLYLRKMLGHAYIERQKAPFDDLWNVDLQAEQIIFRKLKRTFPDIGILSEEAGDLRQGQDSFWVVDPLDGSQNFGSGQADFAVAISLIYQSKLVLGVIYRPRLQEMFTALYGYGARLNGSPIHVSIIDRLAQAMIHFGEFERDEYQVNRQQLQEFTWLADHAKRTRISGSSSFDFTNIASGRAEALVMHGPDGGNPWDIWAGRLILEEAGGHSSLHPYVDGHTLALYSNGQIHDQLIHLLASTDL